jgi:pyruvate/2-oxoglutarate dehydrogenase complex dihydrolipoamide dehydrogenase (E3) component
MALESFDLIVIGSGGAGREAATRAHLDHGAAVAVVENGLWGGSCANVACKPTKQYAATADLLADLRVASDLGVTVPPFTFDLNRLKKRKDWLVGTQADWRQRFVDTGFTAIDGDATLVAENAVRIHDRVLTAERILISTGSRTAVPPIDGIDTVPWIDSSGALELTVVPDRLLVLGAGAVGLEFAQAFARFGSRVILAEGADRIAIRSDAAAAAELHAALAGDGIDIVANTFVTKVAGDGEAIVATLAPRDGAEPRTVVTDALLIASGRRPNIEGLGLEGLGIETSRAGIVTDERMRTSVSGIWAAGDVAVGIQLTPVAAYQAQIAVLDMFNGAREADFSIVPTAIFTDPELAQVGKTEAEAKDAGFDVETATVYTRDLLKPAYTIARDAVPRGLIKLVYERGSNRVLGLHAVCRGGAELVQGYSVALRLGVTIEDIAFGHYIFPTIGEGVVYAAQAALAQAAVKS